MPATYEHFLTGQGSRSEIDPGKYNNIGDNIGIRKPAFHLLVPAERFFPGPEITDSHFIIGILIDQMYFQLGKIRQGPGMMFVGFFPSHGSRTKIDLNAVTVKSAFRSYSGHRGQYRVPWLQRSALPPPGEIITI